MKRLNNNNFALGEDFYSFNIDEKEIKPKDISQIKVSNENVGKMDKRVFNAYVSGSEQDKV